MLSPAFGPQLTKMLVELSLFAKIMFGTLDTPDDVQAVEVFEFEDEEPPPDEPPEDPPDTVFDDGFDGGVWVGDWLIDWVGVGEIVGPEVQAVPVASTPSTS